MNIDKQWIGLCEYSKACVIQEQLVSDVLQNKKPIILGFEHQTVITQGLRGKREDLRALPNAKAVNAATESAIKAADSLPSRINDIPVFWMRRGGAATLHSPGQLVIYPIVSLSHLGMGVKDFVGHLEGAMIELLKSCGLEAGRKPGLPGIYTDLGKIGFVGLQVHRGVSFHGIAINVSNDLSLFSNIVSCGVDAQPMDSFKNRGVNKDLQQLFEAWVDAFAARIAKV